MLEDVRCALEKRVYPASFGWKALYIWLKSIWSNALFEAWVPLLILCLEERCVDGSRV